MPIKVKCQCGKVIGAPDKFAGKTVKCPNCSEPLKIPAGGQEAPAAPKPQPKPQPEQPAQPKPKAAAQPAAEPEPEARPAPAEEASPAKAVQKQKPAAAKAASKAKPKRAPSSRQTTRRKTTGGGARTSRRGAGSGGRTSRRGGAGGGGGSRRGSRRGGGGGKAKAPPRPIEGAVGGIAGRFVALLIDGILLSVLSGAILFGVVGSEVVSVAASMGATAQEAASAEDAASAEEGREAVAEAATEGAAAIGGKLAQALVALALVLALQVPYSIVFEGAMSATVGKMAMGLRVTKKDKTPCGFVKAIIRNVVKCVLNIISMIVALFTSDRQAVHDLAAGTLVIKKGAPEPEDTPEGEEFEDEDEEEEGAEDEAAEEDEIDDIDDLDDEED